MAIETITREGDFVLKNARGSDMFRFRAGDDMFTVSMSVTTSLTMGADEAQELRDWLTRRLAEAL